MCVPSTFSSRTKTARPLALWPVDNRAYLHSCLFFVRVVHVTFYQSLLFFFGAGRTRGRGSVITSHWPFVERVSGWWGPFAESFRSTQPVCERNDDLAPLAVTAYRSSPLVRLGSGRHGWIRQSHPAGVPWARVSAFIAWIVSAVFACCIASFEPPVPWCSSPCIMVSIRAIRGVGVRRHTLSPRSLSY